jgi:hypothetical protein
VLCCALQWGSNPPNAAAFLTPAGTAVTFEPYITDFTDPLPGTCVGFCPTEVVDSNTVVSGLANKSQDNLWAHTNIEDNPVHAGLR